MTTTHVHFETKRCPKCESLLDVKDFNKGTSAKGLQSWCRKCCNHLRLINKLNNTKSYQDQLIRARKTKQKIKVKLRSYFNDKRRNDEQYSIAQRLRSRTRHIFERQNLTKETEYLIGCTYQELRTYIKSLFKPGMNWENRGEWEIDHIIPFIKYDLTKPENRKAVCHYTNIQPLWKIENRKKFTD